MSNEASPVLKTKSDDQKNIELLTSIYDREESRPWKFFHQMKRKQTTYSSSLSRTKTFMMKHELIRFFIDF